MNVSSNATAAVALLTQAPSRPQALPAQTDADGDNDGSVKANPGPGVGGKVDISA